MKYIIVTYNYLTLIRAIKYIDSCWKKENSIIIYINLVSELPKQISKDYHIDEVLCKPLSLGKKGISLLLQNCFDARRTWNRVKKHFISEENESILIVFKDNEVLESTIIENVHKLYKDKVHIWLLEEGSGLYATETVHVRYPLLKQLFYHIFQVSSYMLKNESQGFHPYLEKVICTKPELFKRKREDNKVVIEQMEEVFTPMFNRYFVHAILGEKKEKVYDFVFLTQPFKDWKDSYDELLIKHEMLLPKVFELLSKYGKTIIKLHPREHFDYRQYINENIDIVEGIENNIPFECLMDFYGNPQMISMFSSTSINIESSKCSIYLGKMFGIPIMDKLFTSDFYKKNKIISCNCLEELEKAIYK